jgi:hypothetical protein
MPRFMRGIHGAFSVSADLLIAKGRPMDAADEPRRDVNICFN